MVDLTWKQRKEMIKAIDAAGGIFAIQKSQTLPVDFIELALINAYEMSEGDLNAMAYTEMQEKAMAVFVEVFLKADAEKKS